MGRAYRLLLVEDNLLIRDMFTYGIGRCFRSRRSEVEIDHAADGREALDLLQRTAYDLAIVDYYLPGPDGAAIVTTIREDPRLAGMPVVAISVGGADARRATLDAGADVFLDKPLVLRDLFALVERLTQGRV
jgi:CheY-like chemotaxis protein